MVSRPVLRHLGALPKHVVAAALTGLLLVAGLLYASQPAQAAGTPIDVGVAADNSVLAGSAISNTLNTELEHSIGISETKALTGFPPGTTQGETHLQDNDAALAQTARGKAYDDAKTRKFDRVIAGGVLNDDELPPGVYKADAALEISGTLTLNGHADPDSVFIFQVGDALNTVAESEVVLINGASPCNVFWQVGASATLGADSTFAGTILADASTTVGARTNVVGRVLVQAAVTLADNQFSMPDCGAAQGDGDSGGGAAAGDTDTDTAADAAADSDSDTDAAGDGAGDSDSDTDAAGDGAGDSDSDTDAAAGGIGDSGSGSDADSGSALPDTGAQSTLAPALMWGLVLVTLGSFVVAAARRRKFTGRHL